MIKKNEIFVKIKIVIKQNKCQFLPIFNYLISLNFLFDSTFKKSKKDFD